MVASLKRTVPVKSSLNPISTTTLAKSCRATSSSLSTASSEASYWGNLPGAASTNNPESCLTRSLERKLESSRLEFCRALTVEYSATIPRLSAASPSGRSRSIIKVFSADSWVRASAKLQAIVVTPTPPLAPRKTNNLPPACFGRRISGRRAETRSRASAMVVWSKGSVRNSRTPACIQ